MGLSGWRKFCPRKGLALQSEYRYATRMRKADAVSHFGTQQKLAEALGRSQSTVAGWGEVVPLDCAFLLEKLTRKNRDPLKVDLSLYPKVPKSLRAAP